DTDVQSAIGTLGAQSLDSGTRTLMANRLRAIVAQGEQDMLYVVPLPASVWAGLGMLGMCAGLRSYRRR
ncbi:MAG: hypothetical protein NXI07_01950, partial [bacterium]|nr:hypothetical protein [bacterium]